MNDLNIGERNGFSLNGKERNCRIKDTVNLVSLKVRIEVLSHALHESSSIVYNFFGNWVFNNLLNLKIHIWRTDDLAQLFIGKGLFAILLNVIRQCFHRL